MPHNTSLQNVIRSKHTKNIVNKIRNYRYGRFHDVQQKASGMLRARQYKRLYDRLRTEPDFDVVEIGGAEGAASIALAWAMIDEGKQSKVIVVEK